MYRCVYMEILVNNSFFIFFIFVHRNSHKVVVFCGWSVMTLKLFSGNGFNIFCILEKQENNDIMEFDNDKGYGPDISALKIFCRENPYQIFFHGGKITGLLSQDANSVHVLQNIDLFHWLSARTQITRKTNLYFTKTWTEFASRLSNLVILPP